MFRTSVLGISVIIALLGTAFAAQQTQKNDTAEQSFSEWRNKPKEKFKNGAQAFEDAKKALLKEYVDKGLTEDDLYRAAVQGMLNNIDPERAEWNRLLTPAEYSELKTDLSGKVAGIGVGVRFNEHTGNGEIIDVVPEGPGARAGLAVGDQILKVDGRGFKEDKQLRDLVYAIRGPSGSALSLSVLHDDQVRQVSLKREQLVFGTVDSSIIGDDVGLLRIYYFSKETPTVLKKALETLKSKGVKKLVVDLRSNEGGMLDGMIGSAHMLIPKGQAIVRVRGRAVKEELIVSKGETILPKMPVVVLTNNGTKSGAEVLAAALKVANNATVIGNATFGKWSAQRVEELKNKYAIKYTVSTFLGADGQDYSGKGFAPDIVIDAKGTELPRSTPNAALKQRMKDDLQLNAGLKVLSVN